MMTGSSPRVSRAQRSSYLCQLSSKHFIPWNSQRLPTTGQDLIIRLKVDDRQGV